MKQMIQTVKLPNCNEVFKIKTISANRMANIQKKHCSLFGTFNTIELSKELAYVCTVFPDFESKEALMDYLTPGQFSVLLEKIMNLNDFS